MTTVIDQAPSPVAPTHDVPAGRDRVNLFWRLANATVAVHLFAVLHDLLSIAARATTAALMLAAAAGAARGLPARLGPRGRAGLALLVGLPALASGVGISLTRVALGRTGASELSGLVSLALAGVGLTLLSIVLLLGSFRRRWTRWLALPVALVLLLEVVAPVVAGLSITHRPPSPVCCSTPADFGLTAASVRVPTANGLTLAGWYVASRNGAAVVTLHGSGGSRTATLPQAAVLARHGYGVLLLDARGHGRSQGPTMPMAWGADGDVPAAVSWLLRRPDVHEGRVGLLGLSMGAETALSGAADDSRVRAVVAEGAGVRTMADFRALPETMSRRLLTPTVWLTMMTVDAFTQAATPMPLRVAVQRLGRRPVLLISGSDPDERDANRAYKAAGSASVQSWDLPDTPPTRALARHPRAYERRVISFFDAALG